MLIQKPASANACAHAIFLPTFWHPCLPPSIGQLSLYESIQQTSSSPSLFIDLSFPLSLSTTSSLALSSLSTALLLASSYYLAVITNPPTQ